MTVLELINKAREDSDFDVIGAINVKEYLPINEKREVTTDITEVQWIMRLQQATICQ